MQSYINYLLEDIQNACRPEKEHSLVPKEETMAAHFAEIERWLESNPEHTLSHYCGLNTEQFPPSERLSEEQICQVNDALGVFLFSWNIDVSLPDEVPPALRYTLMVSLLDTKMDITEYGCISFDFCEGNTENCRLCEFCRCRDQLFGPDDDFDEFLARDPEGRG